MHGGHGHLLVILKDAEVGWDDTGDGHLLEDISKDSEVAGSKGRRHSARRYMVKLFIETLDRQMISG